MATDASSLIAERYARALFSLGKQDNALDALLGDLQDLSKLAKTSGEFARLLKSPLLPRAKKASVLETLLAQAKAHPLTRQFMQRLALNARLSALPEITRAFENHVRAERGEIVAEVTAAQEMTQKQMNEIGKALADATGRPVSLVAKTDPAALGGLAIKISDTLIDATVAGKLSRLGQTLKTAA